MTLLFRKYYGCSTGCLNPYGKEMSLLLSLTLYIRTRNVKMDRNFPSSSTPTSGVGSPQADFPGLGPIRIWTSARMRLHNLPGQFMPMFDHSHCKKSLVLCQNRINFQHFILCPLLLILPRASLRSIWLCVLYSPPSGIFKFIRFLWASSFPVWTIPASSASPHRSHAPNHWSPSRSSSCFSMSTFLLYHGDQHSGCAFSSAEERRKICQWHYANAAQDGVGLHCCKVALLAHVQQKQIFLKSCFQKPAPSLHWCMEVFIFQVQDFTISFVELLEIPVCHFLPLVKSHNSHTIMWCINYSFQVHGVCSVSEGVLCPIVQVTNRDVKWHYSQYQSLGTALLMGCQVIFVSVITDL